MQARDKALTRREAKAGSRLMPDSHNAEKQTGWALESALDGFSAPARSSFGEPEKPPAPAEPYLPARA